MQHLSKIPPKFPIKQAILIGFLIKVYELKSFVPKGFIKKIPIGF
jgi:hypothetical protein